MSNELDQFLNGRLPCSALESELIAFAREQAAQLATAKEQLREMTERPTPRFDSYWNSYRSGAINANDFKEAMRQMERDLEGRVKEAEALNNPNHAHQNHRRT